MDADEPSSPNLEEEKIEMQACYAVAMHLEANRKIGKIARWLTVVGVITCIYFHSLWPLAVAFGASIAAYFFIIQSCVRYVERTTGMPPDAQALFSRQYKTDRAFARKVDKLAPAKK